MDGFGSGLFGFRTGMDSYFVTKVMFRASSSFGYPVCTIYNLHLQKKKKRGVGVEEILKT